MGLFDTFHIKRAINALANSPPSSGERANAAARLRALGSRAVPKLIEALHRDHSGACGQLLGELVTNATLPLLVENGLLNDDVEVANRAKRALLGARQIDPNRLLELFLTNGGAVADIADLLISRKEAIVANRGRRP